MKRLALFLVGALVIGPALAFVVAEDGRLGLDPRETLMLKTVCAGGTPVCTFFHFANLSGDIERLAVKAYKDGAAAGEAKADAQAEGCKGGT